MPFLQVFFMSLKNSSTKFYFSIKMLNVIVMISQGRVIQSKLLIMFMLLLLGIFIFLKGPTAQNASHNLLMFMHIFQLVSISRIILFNQKYSRDLQYYHKLYPLSCSIRIHI